MKTSELLAINCQAFQKQNRRIKRRRDASSSSRKSSTISLSLFPIQAKAGKTAVKFFINLLASLLKSRDTKQTGSIASCDKKETTFAGQHVFELSKFRCADCGVSLFFQSGVCAVCNCKFRIRRKKEQ